MFTFKSDYDYEILERDVIFDEMIQKYHDKYMIVLIRPQKNNRSCGNIVAILTPDEYYNLEWPNPVPNKYVVWKGFSLKLEGMGVYGFYL
ncbi:MAG: hypothetical protein FWG65_04305 [Turicibacter sp.]|nr:hypothetical protein [Turicibacter sp.]